MRGKCLKKGHYARECKSRVVSSNLVEIVSSDEYELNTMEVENVSSSETCNVAHRKLIKLNATIGTNKFVGLLDTGATFCFMSKQVANRSQIVFTSDNVEKLPDVGTFSNVTCKALGVAKNVIVHVFTSSIKLDFIVIDCKHDLILGIPWLEAVKASMEFDSSGCKLTLGKKVCGIRCRL